MDPNGLHRFNRVQQWQRWMLYARSPKSLSDTQIQHFSRAHAHALSVCLSLSPSLSMRFSLYLSLSLSASLPAACFISHTTPEWHSSGRKRTYVKQTPTSWGSNPPRLEPVICLWAGGQRGHFYGTTAVACVNAPPFSSWCLSGRNLNLWTLKQSLPKRRRDA